MKNISYMLLLVSTLALSACGTDPAERTVTGAGIGAGAGAVGGALMGNPLAGAAIGGVAGGATGALTSPSQVNLNR